MRKKGLPIIKIFLVLLCAQILLFIYIFFSVPRELAVKFFNVGQGDAILIRTPHGHNILIDGGPDNTLLSKVGLSMPIYDRTIDLAVLTHPQADHYAGFIELFNHYRVKHLLISGAHNKRAKGYRLLIEKALRVETVFLKADRKKKIYLGENVFLELLYPKEDISSIDFKDMNQASLIVKLTYKDMDFLFTGDSGFEHDKFLLLDDIRAEILKVAHHGSKYATSEQFLERVSPKYAIIQSGKNNRFGHPAKETLERLAAFHAIVLRNDEKGDIVITTDGSELKVKE